MQFLEWQPEFSVSISKFDHQHKKLFGLAQNLNAAMHAGRGREVLGPLLTELITYIKVHFSEEEQVLAEHSYPEIAHHRAEHSQLISNLEHFQRRFNAGEVLISIDLMEFLRRWITNHILQTDTRYGDYLNRLGVY